MTLPNMQTSPALANALADTTRESASHVRAALETLPEPASLHYTNPADFDRAVAEHRERLRQLQAIADDLDNLARHLDPPEPLCPKCNQHHCAPGFGLCRSCQQFDAAEIQPGQKILEPSAGTGNLLAALSPEARVDATAIEISPALASNLRNAYPARVLTGDFLSYEPGATMSFPRIVMNPPFENGADIRHIQHARRFLAKGGRLVAICANGPKQRAALMDDAAEWIDLPAGSFASQGTGVNTALVIFTA